MSIYTRANTDWLSNCRLGIGVHWTAMTMPRRGRALPFADAVAAFRSEGKRVLLHCVAAQSRTPAVADVFDAAFAVPAADRIMSLAGV